SACLRSGVLQHATANLIEFDALEQRLEIAFAETLIALALDDLEEDRTNGVLGEDLQKQTAIFRRTIHQDAVAFEARHIFTMTFDAVVETFVIGFWRILKWHTRGLQIFHRVINIVATQRDV